MVSIMTIGLGYLIRTAGITQNTKQICRDYTNNTGLNLPYPAMATLICGRNVLMGTEMVLTQRQGAYLAGTPVLKVETMKSPDFNVTRETHPHLVHIANVITTNIAPNGLRQVNAFPQLGGRSGRPVMYPVLSSKDVYYRLDRLRKMDIGEELPSPYNPE